MSAEKTPKYQKCYMPQCCGYRYELCHKFPRSAGRCKIWVDALNNPKVYATPFVSLRYKFLCSRHFRPDDYHHPQSRKLNFIAVPSLNLKKLNELDKCRHTEMESIPYVGSDCDDWEEEVDMEEEEETKAEKKDTNEQLNNLEFSKNPLGDTIDCNAGKISVSQFHEDSIVSSSVDTNSGGQANITNIADNSFQLLLSDGFMQIVDIALNLQFTVDVLWLRSICGCSQCIDKTTMKTCISFFELPNDLQPVMATVVEETRKLDIIWSDGHTSTYNLNRLYEEFQTKPEKNFKSTSKCLLWSFQHTQYRDDLQPINFFDLIQTNNNVCYKALDRLQKSGVLIIKHMPKNDKDSLIKRSLISKLFNNLFDNLTSEKRQHFPAQATTPYTNCTFESLDKGLQILTVPCYKDNLQVQLALVDGLQVVEQLSKESYDFLKQFKGEYSFKDNKDFIYIVKRVAIQPNDVMERIWYSPFHLQGLKSQDFKQTSKHFKILNDLMKMQQNQWNIEINNETLVILDNYRICWCLKQPSNDIELDCLYMERKHYLSSLSIFNKGMIGS